MFEAFNGIFGVEHGITSIILMWGQNDFYIYTNLPHIFIEVPVADPRSNRSVSWEIPGLARRASGRRPWNNTPLAWRVRRVRTFLPIKKVCCCPTGDRVLSWDPLGPAGTLRMEGKTLIFCSRVNRRGYQVLWSFITILGGTP